MMFTKLLENEVNQRNISWREAARQIGIAHTTLLAAARGRDMDVKTASLICKWMNIPLQIAAGEEGQDEVFALVAKILNDFPELKEVFVSVSKALEAGEITMEDFHEITDFTLFKLEKRKAEVRRQAEHVDLNPPKKDRRKVSG